jgi:hypothetical protein
VRWGGAPTSGSPIRAWSPSVASRICCASPGCNGWRSMSETARRF